MSMQKRKGTAWETACTVYLRRAFEDTEGTIHRAALHGASDEGDIHGLRIGGRKAIVECKNAKTYRLREWMQEAEDEAGNADADYGITFVKLNGLGISKVGEHLAAMPIDTFIRIVGGEVPNGGAGESS